MHASGLIIPPQEYVLDSSTVKDKPTVVYEINAGRPNPYRSEYPMKVAAYARWQDWDGIFWYTFESSTAVDEEYLIMPLLYMNYDHYWTAIHAENDPLMTSAMALAGRLFAAAGGLQPATTPVTYHLGDKDVYSYENANGVSQNAAAFRFGSRFAFDGTNKTGAAVEGPPIPAWAHEAIRPSDQLCWDWPNGRLIIDTPTYKAYVGRTCESYRFKDGIVLSGFNTPFITFAMASVDGKPLVGDNAAGAILLNGMFDARNTGFDFDWSKAVRGGGFVSPMDQFHMIRSKGHAPVLVDKVSYAVSFPTRMTGRFEGFDFALRRCATAEIRDANLLKQSEQSFFMGRLVVDKRGAKAEPAIVPSQIAVESTKTAAAGTAALRVTGLWNPIPGLRWDAEYPLAHQFLRDSTYKFSSITPQDGADKPSKSIVMSDAEILFKSPANIEIMFQKERMTKIVVTFTRPPSLGEAVAAYEKTLGAAVEKQIVSVASDTSKVRWLVRRENAEIEVVLTETQGVMGITCSLHEVQEPLR